MAPIPVSVSLLFFPSRSRASYVLVYLAWKAKIIPDHCIRLCVYIARFAVDLPLVEQNTKALPYLKTAR